MGEVVPLLEYVRAQGSVRLFCDPCSIAHGFTPGEVERIVYALQAMEGDGRLRQNTQDRYYPWTDEYEAVCLEEALAASFDIEQYAEHSTSLIEARRRWVAVGPHEMVGAGDCELCGEGIMFFLHTDPEARNGGSTP